MVSLNEFIDPDLRTSDIIHSSGYAQAQSGSNFGAASSGMSMEQRRQQARGRQTIGSYAQSHLGQRFGAMKARTAGQRSGRAYDASSGEFQDGARYSGNRQQGGVQSSQIDRSVEQRRHFIEPPTRRHDPYA